MSEETRNWKLDRTIRSVPDRCATLMEELLDALNAFAWQPKDIFGIRMAMEEAILNAIRHGNNCDIGKTVTVSIRLSPNEFAATIRDQGKGFDPASLPDPADDENLELNSGRGVKLIRNYMDQVTYNKKGNSLFVRKRRSPPSNASTTNGVPTTSLKDFESGIQTASNDRDGG